jgi:hypothetical protein
MEEGGVEFSNYKFQVGKKLAKINFSHRQFNKKNFKIVAVENFILI